MEVVRSSFDKIYINRYYIAYMHKALLLCALLCAPLYAAQPCHAWEGVICGNHDGDTVTVAPGAAVDLRIVVRLYGIDAPELDQPHGPEAAAALAALLPPGAVVEVVTVNADSYGRVVGLLVHEGRTANLDMLDRGAAWLEPKYCRLKFCRDWAKSQAAAKKAGRGLWAEPAVPPWEWRKARKQ